ncbi:MAG: hypothetical protein GF329_03030 [Candidatus Lokiarchaeota archaeon]|nr:hypothetical protein [Candidatus Lokiarchaeota archaeon]
MKLTNGIRNFNINNRILTWAFVGILLISGVLSGLAGLNMVSHVNSNLTLSTSDISVNNSWEYGSSEYDDGFAITQDSSGNIYLGGITKKTGQYDMILIKVDQNGNQLWNRTWGGSGSEGTAGLAIDTDGNIYVTGYTAMGAGLFDMYLVKYSSSGTRIWNRNRGFTLKTSFGHKIAFDSSDNPYVVGTHDSDIIVYKYSKTGTYQWNQTWDSGDSDHGYDILIDDSDKIYLVGSAKGVGAGERDVVILKYGTGFEGYTTWGGTEDDYGNSICSDATYLYIGGGTWSYGPGGQDVLLVKYDTSLNQQWNSTFGTATLNETSNSIAIYQNSIYLGGNVGMNNPIDDVLLVQMDKLVGLYLFNKTWDSGMGVSDLSDGIIYNSNGYVYMVATADYPDPTKSEIILIQWDLGETAGGIPGFRIEIIMIAMMIILPVILILKKKNKYLNFN